MMEPPKEPTDDSDISDSLPVNLNSSCKITSVNFEGVKRTKGTLLAKIVADLFQANTILGFLEKSVEAKLKLQKLNAFNDIDLVLNPTKGQEKNAFEATFVVQERSRITGSVRTAVDEYSTHLGISASLPNLNGIGDDYEFKSRFNKRFYSGEFKASVPLIPWRYLWNPVYSLSLNKYEWDTLPSGFDQEDRCLNNQVDFLSRPNLQHSVSFENVWRHIKSANANHTPIEIREQFGHSLKSSIKHCMKWDTLVGGDFPSEGVLAKLTNEFTTNLVSGGVKFTRHEASLQYNLLVPKLNVLLQVNLLGGTLLKPARISICDKFFAGGPLTVRGFRYQGLGHNRSGHPLGDMSFFAAGFHLYSFLPYTSPESAINDLIRPHLFLNTGTIGDIHDLRTVSSVDDLKRIGLQFRDSLRYSCGLGLTMYFMRLRLEVNYCLPLIIKEGDMASRGLQYGFGLTYT